MPSSAPAEIPVALWSGIARLRDLSRLVLAAIERDDLATIEALAREGNELVSRISTLVHGGGIARLGDDVKSLLDEVSRSQKKIVEGLIYQKAMVQRDLTELRRTRGKLRALKMPLACPETPLVDRNT